MNALFASLSSSSSYRSTAADNLDQRAKQNSVALERIKNNVALINTMKILFTYCSLLDIAKLIKNNGKGKSISLEQCLRNDPHLVHFIQMIAGHLFQKSSLGDEHYLVGEDAVALAQICDFGYMEDDDKTNQKARRLPFHLGFDDDEQSKELDLSDVGMNDDELKDIRLGQFRVRTKSSIVSQPVISNVTHNFNNIDSALKRIKNNVALMNTLKILFASCSLLDIAKLLKDNGQGLSTSLQVCLRDDHFKVNFIQMIAGHLFAESYHGNYLIDKDAALLAQICRFRSTDDDENTKQKVDRLRIYFGLDTELDLSDLGINDDDLKANHLGQFHVRGTPSNVSQPVVSDNHSHNTIISNNPYLTPFSIQPEKSNNTTTNQSIKSTSLKQSDNEEYTSKSKKHISSPVQLTSQKHEERIKENTEVKIDSQCNTTSPSKADYLELESKSADIFAGKTSNGVIVGYKIAGEIVPLPPELSSPKNYSSNKTITHANELWMVLTLNNPNIKTTNPEVIELIRDNHLESLILQLRINDTMVISPYLGIRNLQECTFIGKYEYRPQDFSGLAESLDGLHARGYAHRNIKPGNMFFYQERVALANHDAAGAVGSFTEFTCTAAYVTKEFRMVTDMKGNNGDNKAKVNPYKRDQYAFFLSMIQIQISAVSKTEVIPRDGLFPDHANQVNRFVYTLPCTPAQQEELRNFLNDPVNNRLSGGLASYLKDTQSAAITLQAYIRRSNATQRLVAINNEKQRPLAATKIQAQIRRFNMMLQPDVKESQSADVGAIKNNLGTIVGYNMHGKKVPLPPQLSQKGDSGGIKSLTHLNPQWVGLTLANSSEKTTAADVIEVIQHKGLDDAMPLQLRINDTMMMARNLGGETLQQHTESGQYSYDAMDFQLLARRLDSFHFYGYAHRDIKPGNMFFYNGRVVLTDHDTAGKVGTFKGAIPYSPPYLTEAIKNGAKSTGDNSNEWAPFNPYKKDHYAFFLSMMQTQFNTIPNKGLFEDHATKVELFIKTLPCNPHKRNELRLFLNDPERHRLSDGLGKYFVY